MFMTARVGLTAAISLFATVLGAGAGGCNHPGPSSSFGNVALTVTVPYDVQVQVITYEITGNGLMPAIGHIKASHPQQQFAKLITHVPAGEDYLLGVSAKSVDGQEICEGTAQIEVRKRATTRVHIALGCRGASDGMVHIAVGVVCPGVRLVSYTVSPLTASVGGTISVAAAAADVDAGSLTFAWSASSGTYAEPAASNTTYRCTTPGPVTMTLLVHADFCQESNSIMVTCVADTTDAGGD
jgi:hypothetical protein